MTTLATLAGAAAIPAARGAARRYLLSEAGQAGAIPNAAKALAASSPETAFSNVGASGAAADAFLQQLDAIEQRRQASQRGRGAIPQASVTGNSTL
jgi:hypothetical protein